MNPCFNETKCAGTGCEIGNKFVGIIMYADDILLLSPTVFGLQKLLNKCSELFNSKQLEYNLSKSKCITIGPASNLNIKPLLLQGGTISWENNFKYLGVNFLADKKLTVDTDIIKRKFFSACNSILCKTRQLDEITRLCLIETSCITLLTYAIAALNLRDSQLNDLNVSWNNVFRIIFGFHKWESVKSFMCGVGRLDIYHLRLRTCLSFMKNYLASNNDLTRYLMQRFYINNFDHLCARSNLPHINLTQVSHFDIKNTVHNIFFNKVLSE